MGGAGSVGIEGVGSAAYGAGGSCDHDTVGRVKVVGAAIYIPDSY